MTRKLHKNTGADGEDDADCEWESEPLGEGQKKFDTRLTRVLLVRINRRQRSRGIAGGENLFLLLNQRSDCGGFFDSLCLHLVKIPPSDTAKNNYNNHIQLNCPLFVVSIELKW